jgi:4-alpha-glucanotransferase
MLQAVTPLQRSCGILLHPTSLPGAFGIGGLGEEARTFVEFLAAGRQSLWQVLPLGPTGYADSPYQSFSAFAGNALLIDPAILAQEGLLAASDLSDPPAFPAERVDYGTVIPYRIGLLASAWRRWSAAARDREGLEVFRRASASWLPDYALFMALKRHFAKRDLFVWNRWPAELARRDAGALRAARRELAEELEFEEFQQYQFIRQWGALKHLAAEKGIRLIGDIPIFVAFDSADVWAHQELFRLTPAGEPEVVAGVPPDYFSPTGQLWGNPLYNWGRLAADGYRWWLQRVRAALALVDLVRLDHFRGFQACWEVRAGRPTAERGRWVKGPGAELLAALAAELGELPLIAEDLGVITPAVQRLRDRFKLPGMKVLQFAFDGDPDNPFLPHNFGQRCVVYTGTHDNDTTLGWYQAESEKAQDQVRRYLARDGHDLAWDLVRLAYASVAAMAVVPLQDLMKLGSEARMNYPSRAQGNWQWRFTPGMLTREISGRLRELALLYGRCPPEPEEPPPQERSRQAPCAGAENPP